MGPCGHCWVTGDQGAAERAGWESCEQIPTAKPKTLPGSHGVTTSSFWGSGDGCLEGGVMAVGSGGGAGRRSPVSPREEGEGQALAPCRSGLAGFAVLSVFTWKRDYIRIQQLLLR